MSRLHYLILISLLTPLPVFSAEESLPADVKSYIISHYTEPTQNKAVQQLASALQQTLSPDAAERDIAKVISLTVTRAISCVFQQFGDGKEPYPAKVVKEIETLTANTPAKRKAYEAYNKALDGTTSALPQGNTCE